MNPLYVPLITDVSIHDSPGSCSLWCVIGQEKEGVHLSTFPFSSWLLEVSLNAFEEAVGNGLITGVNIKNSTINVSHLFYADDVIITTDWNAKDMDNIIRVLHVFYLASGLKINIHKSNIYGIGVNQDEVLSMASNAGCIAGHHSLSWSRRRFDTNGCSLRAFGSNFVGTSNFLHSKEQLKEQDGNYKHIANLAKTTFGVRANYASRKPEIQRLWDENQFCKKVAE
ncbi:hypothetical protein Tco_0328399 [Tanacetum coccineum]